jgi:hypothetical protein
VWCSQLVPPLTTRVRAQASTLFLSKDLEDDSMSQSKHRSAAVRRAEHTNEGRESATTAEGLAAQQALLIRRRGTAHATTAARRLEHAARADRRAA